MHLGRKQIKYINKMLHNKCHERDMHRVLLGKKYEIPHIREGFCKEGDIKG